MQGDLLKGDGGKLVSLRNVVDNGTGGAPDGLNYALSRACDFVADDGLSPAAARSALTLVRAVDRALGCSPESSDVTRQCLITLCTPLCRSNIE